MDNKILPLKLYIVPIINIQGNEHDYIIDEEVDHNED